MIDFINSASLIVATICIFAIPIIFLVKLFRRTLKSGCFTLVVPLVLFVISFLIFGLTSSSTWCDHEYVETERVLSTCTEKGYVVYHCDLCENDKKETLGLKKHKYDEAETVSPTCTENGYISYHCDLCGKDYKENLHSKGHKFTNGQCSMCKFIDINSEAGYKLSCKHIEYEELSRNPDVYKGELIYFEGKVFQVDGDIYLIEVTKGEYNLWDDIVYVTYSLPKNSPKVLADDIVKFYGAYKGD